MGKFDCFEGVAAAYVAFHTSEVETRADLLIESVTTDRATRPREDDETGAF